ncbi:MAG: hypothetical protein GC193_13175 [Cryomorphaceae bacterium]|nr:hypothetical protein [Cryomorphaceae bacterium]
MNVNAKVVATLGSEPITVAEAKNYLKVDFGADDALIERCIVAARAYVERYIDATIVQATIDATFSNIEFENELCVDLPRGAVSEITSVTQYDDKGVGDIIEEYYLLPSNRLRIPDYNATSSALVVRYQANMDAVPEPIISAMLMIIGDLYQTRSGSVMEASTSEVNFSVAKILAPFRNTIFLG